jgi:hypothetical protein
LNYFSIMRVPYTIGDVLDTADGPARLLTIHPDGDLELEWDCTPGEVYTISPWLVRGRTHDQQTDKRERQTYTKHILQPLSKSRQNTAFVQYLGTLGRPMRELVVLVLDTRACHTINALLLAGLLPSRIYIPQPDVEEAHHIQQTHPTVKVFPGYRAGDLIWHLAGTQTRFHGMFLDYCGMPGDIGRKNTPADDLSNIQKYRLLQDRAVLAHTTCARSHQRVTRKFDSFLTLLAQERKIFRGHNVYKTKRTIYTDPASQTMCHYQCILQKK